MRRPAAAAVAALVTVLATATATPASAAYRGTGDATSYPANDGLGSCSYGPVEYVRIAALNQADYADAHMGGAYVEVTGSRGRVVVKIIDRCPECARGDIDLNRAVYDRVADPLQGRVRVSWRLVSPDTSNKPSFRYEEGSSQYWCAVQIRNHRNPVAKLEIMHGGAWRTLPRTDYNYFLVNDGRGGGGDLRVTDIHGQQLVERNIAFRPGVVQVGSTQFARH